MARVTSDEVAEIVEVDSTISMTPFITVANLMVTKHCVDTAFTVTELKEIERWLSAHFYCIRDKRRTSEAVDGASESYQHTEDLGLDSNEYGQMAMRLDWSGALSSLNNSSKKGLRTTANLDWAGIAKADATETVLM
jgi:hypothetical protein